MPPILWQRKQFWATNTFFPAAWGPDSTSNPAGGPAIIGGPGGGAEAVGVLVRLQPKRTPSRDRQVSQIKEHRAFVTIGSLPVRLYQSLPSNGVSRTRSKLRVR